MPNPRDPEFMQRRPQARLARISLTIRAGRRSAERTDEVRRTARAAPRPGARTGGCSGSDEPAFGCLRSRFWASSCAKRGQGMLGRKGLRQHKILLAAARVVAGPEARMVRIRAEREGLVTVASVLEHVALGALIRMRWRGGEVAAGDARPGQGATLRAETFHYLGVLNLDPFTAHRTFENHE